MLVLHDGGPVGGQAALLQAGEQVVQVDAAETGGKEGEGEPPDRSVRWLTGPIWSGEIGPDRSHRTETD